MIGDMGQARMHVDRIVRSALRMVKTFVMLEPFGRVHSDLSRNAWRRPAGLAAWEGVGVCVR